MADEADMGNERMEKWLEGRLAEHQYRLNQVGDREAEICTGCTYATKASLGKKCDGWADCLKDHERAAQAKARSGK